jgi:hypothetical protein
MIEAVNTNFECEIEKYYNKLHKLWSSLAEKDQLSYQGNGLRMSISSVKEIIESFPEMLPKDIINNTQHYSGWYGTMGHMAKFLNERETYNFLLDMGLDPTIEDYYGENCEW